MSGVLQVTGSANGWPFLYHGMEHESIDPNQFYYSGGGAYYSAQIMRSMSMTGAQGSSGAGGGPGPGQASLPSVGSSGADLASPANIAGAEASGDAAAGATLFAIGGGIEAGSGGSLTPVAVAYFAAVGIYELFDLAFGGGSPDYPPNYWTFQFRATRTAADIRCTRLSLACPRISWSTSIARTASAETLIHAKSRRSKSRARCLMPRRRVLRATGPLRN
jgi:hypothetical protein